jgi:hypothetical protein
MEEMVKTLATGLVGVTALLVVYFSSANSNLDREILDLEKRIRDLEEETEHLREDNEAVYDWSEIRNVLAENDNV